MAAAKTPKPKSRKFTATVEITVEAHVGNASVKASHLKAQLGDLLETAEIELTTKGGDPLKVSAKLKAVTENV